MGRKTLKGKKTTSKRPQQEAPSSESEAEGGFGAEDAGDYVPRTQERVEQPAMKKAGSFQTMGLLPTLQRAIQKKGFRLPTPIQRKCIPALLTGRDVVGMARTGSGKTAAFVIPMVQTLRSHSLKVGIRGLVLAPSRELALQTFAVVKDMTRGTDLRSILLVGGDSVETQFAQLATNPDIVVATPGRLMHLCVETRLSLKEVQYVVWDEADRLMEDVTMAQQLQEIHARLPETRQSALFSATLPKALADFAQAGLRDPLLVRLDTETKLSPDLDLAFFQVHNENKDAALLLLLRRLLNAGSDKCLTVVFVATKHHVEYLQELLSAFNLPCAYIYGSLDQVARNMAIEAFRRGQKPILVVTDVAARGLDIPLLDHVINYDFPATPKLFVHRVGRVARAGRPGRALSLVTPDELSFLFDLQLFLGRPIVAASAAPKGATEDKAIVLGTMPQMLLDEEDELLTLKLQMNSVLASQKGVVLNACKLYRKTRPAPSPESHRRCKEFVEANPLLGNHPFFASPGTDGHVEQAALLHALQNFKPRTCHLFLGKPTVTKRSLTASTAAAAAAVPSNSRRDPTFYLNYQKTDHHDDAGYSLTSSFAEQARNAVFDLNGSADEPFLRGRGGKRAPETDRNRLVKTEFGTKVPASFRSDAYDKWRAKTHLDIQQPGEFEAEPAAKRASAILSSQDEKRKWRKLPKKRHQGNKSK